MARQLRVSIRGRYLSSDEPGDRREEIFRDDLDRKNFLQTLGAACKKTGWQVHAYCLMSNHFHLVIETPRANLVAGMKWLLGTYLGCEKTELANRRKADPQKVTLARDLRSQTTMSLKWIARRLEMGSWTHVSNLLRQ